MFGISQKYKTDTNKIQHLFNRILIKSFNQFILHFQKYINR